MRSFPNLVERVGGLVRLSSHRIRLSIKLARGDGCVDEVGARCSTSETRRLADVARPGHTGIFIGDREFTYIGLTG